MFIYGAPNGHSITLNLAWLHNFSAQLLGGELYPRWLVDMNQGAGSPVFFYYAPLPFYVCSVAVLLCPMCKAGTQLAIGEWFLLAASGLSFYYFARQRCGALPAMLGALLYMSLPYHFEIDLWTRQAVGELAAYIWMPLILHYVDRISTGKEGVAGLAITYSLLLFSHLPGALLFSICLLVYIVELSFLQGSRQLMTRSALGIGLGLLLAAIYLVPALLAQQYISPEKLWGYFDFRRAFFPMSAPRSAFADRLFLVLVISTVLFATLWLVVHRYCRALERATMIPWLSLVGLAWFMMTPLSRPLWELVPVLQKVQFPWRIAMVLDLATSVTAAYAIQCAVTTRHAKLVAAVGVSLLLLLYCGYTGRYVLWGLDHYKPSRYIEQRDTEVRTGKDAPEYTTAWVRASAEDLNAAIASNGKVRFDSAKGTVRVTRWAPREIELEAELTDRTDLIVRQFYFPGWRAKILDDDATIGVEVSEPTGLLKIIAPPGRYRLTLDLAPLWQEIVGASLSAAGLLALGFWIAANARHTVASSRARTT
jgi:hypothetical protein